jgi:hypothetical protein
MKGQILTCWVRINIKGRVRNGSAFFRTLYFNHTEEYFLKELLRKSVDLYKLSWKSFHWLTQFEGKKIIFTTRNYIMTNVVEFDILM